MAAAGALFILGFCYLSWLPLNLAMPIQESRWVRRASGFRASFSSRCSMRVALAFVVLTLAKERGAMERRADALTDALTGLPNRRALFEAADAFGQDRDLDGGAISVLIFDLDHFKQTNDRYGHAFGDRVLKLFATTVRGHVDGRGIVAGLGGEEFAAILPCRSAGGRRERGGRAARLRQFRRLRRWSCGWATVSVGVASDAGGGSDLNALFRRADAALYAAKHAGRNCVTSGPENLGSPQDLRTSLRATVRKASGGAAFS